MVTGNNIRIVKVVVQGGWVGTGNNIRYAEVVVQGGGVWVS